MTSAAIVAVSQPSAGIALQSPKPALQPPTKHDADTQPLVDACGSVHAVAHAPQFAALVLRSTHEPAQFIRPAPHDVAQVPVEQTWPALHACPQVPQLWKSDIVSAHAPPHTSSLPGHATWQ